MNAQQFTEAVFAAAKNAGIEDFEVYYQLDVSNDVRTFDGEPAGFNSSTLQGCCFRCIADGKLGYCSTELFEPEEAEYIVKKALESAHYVESADKVFIHGVGDTYEKTEENKKPLPTGGDLIDFALKLEKEAMSLSPLMTKGTMAIAVSGKTVTRIVNSKGLSLEGTSAYVGTYLSAMAAKDGVRYNGGAFDFADSLGELDYKAIAKRAVDDVLSGMDAGTTASGKYTVAFTPDTAATMLATFSPIFSAESAQKGLSLLAGKEGEIIGSPVLTLIDDPFYAKSPVKTSFDAEGVATHTKDIITEGKLNTLLYNLKTGNTAGNGRAGNAAKGGYAGKVSTAPFTFYIKPGEKTAGELYEEIGNGILISELMGTHAGANPITGDFSLESKGFLIKDGKKAGPIDSFTVAGNIYELMKKISAVGSDLLLQLPSGSSVFGAPTVVVSELAIAGK